MGSWNRLSGCVHFPKVMLVATEPNQCLGEDGYTYELCFMDPLKGRSTQDREKATALLNSKVEGRELWLHSRPVPASTLGPMMVVDASWSAYAKELLSQTLPDEVKRLFE